MRTQRGALVVRHDQLERAVLCVERCSAHGIGDQDFRVRGSGIEFGQREHRAIAIGGHRGAAEIFAFRDAGTAQQIVNRHAFINLRLVGVRIEHAQRLALETFQIGGEFKRSADSAADF
jgi:hypothetical protein